MAANNEFRTARLNGAVDDGADLVAQWANLEAAIRNAFGITADTDYSEAMQIATGPNITMTGDLILAGNPTTDLMAAPKQYLTANATSFGSAMARAYLTSDQDIPTSTGGYLEWDTADINVGSMWSAEYPSRFTIPTDEDGYYLFGFTLAFDTSAGAWSNECYVSLWHNRATEYELASCYWDDVDEYAMCGNVVLPSLVAGDYVEFKVSARTGGTGVNIECYMDSTTAFGMRVY
jgi:hypothetical protein